MTYARRRLTLFLMPLLFAAGACADRAENATGQAALDRQLNRVHQPDTSVSASTEPATPSPSALRQKAMRTPTPQRTIPAQPAPEQTRPAMPQPATAVTRTGVDSADSGAPESAPVPTARTPRTVTMTVPIGAVLNVSLNQQLSTEDNRAGDTFSTTLQEPYVEGNTVLLPAGAIIQGRVTASQQSTRVGRTAVLKLAFESVSFYGHSYPLSAAVMDANPERRSRSSTTTAGKIAAGAAAGALLGRILGKDTKSTVTGAAIGAAAGTAIALGTQDVDAVLPRDSRMVIRLDRPVAVRVKVP
jgi:hypothetical protein